MKPKKVMFVSPVEWEQMEVPNAPLSETREMLIKGNYCLYFSDESREFFWERKITKNEEIQIARQEAFEALVLFKEALNENKAINSLEPKL